MTKRLFLVALSLLATASLVQSDPGKGDSSLTIIKFEADWCGPCQQMKPIFDSVSKETKNKGVSFRSVDVDKNPKLAAQYKAEYLPTTVAVKDGKVVGRKVGFMNARQLRGFINRYK